MLTSTSCQATVDYEPCFVMKITLVQQNYHIGNFQSNTGKIISAIETAKIDGADLVVFSELCVCGYPPRDFLYFSDFINSCELALQQIKEATKDIAVLVGLPRKNEASKGKPLFNSVYFIENQIIKATIDKTCLPTYDVFDEDRYFEQANEWNVVSFKGKKIAVTICEDIWNMGNHPLYNFCPMDKLMVHQPDLMINLSASPFDYTHDSDRHAILKANALKYGIPIFYCNTVGSQTEIVFDGHSLVMDAQGNLRGKLNSFKEDLQTFEWDDEGNICHPVLLEASKISDEQCDPATFHPEWNIASVHDAIVTGIKDYFTKMGFNKALIGSSGGIDSAVTLALAAKALGSENVLSVLMPSAFSSDHSVADAVRLSENLESKYHVIPINEVYDAFLNALNPLFKELPFGLAEENLQSRTRGNLLMGIANKHGYILLNTSNKSELATGYGTLYGDMAGGISVLGDCYKTQVYALAKFINRNKEIIPSSIIEKAPSAELRPNQKDADSLPEYHLLDEILYQYIEHHKSPNEIKKTNNDAGLVDKVLKLVNTNEYKRNQFCPIIRISPKSFGLGRRMPIVGKYLS